MHGKIKILMWYFRKNLYRFRKKLYFAKYHWLGFMMAPNLSLIEGEGGYTQPVSSKTHFICNYIINLPGFIQKTPRTKLGYPSTWKLIRIYFMRLWTRPNIITFDLGGQLIPKNWFWKCCFFSTFLGKIWIKYYMKTNQIVKFETMKFDKP